MEPSAVRTALANAVKIIPDLRSLDHLVDSIEPPIWMSGEMIIDYDQLAEGGLLEMSCTGHLYTSYASERAGQKLLDRYLAPSGEYSVKAAIEVDRTLGGVVIDSRVTRVTGYGTYTIANTRYSGARITCMAWGI